MPKPIRKGGRVYGRTEKPRKSIGGKKDIHEQSTGPPYIPPVSASKLPRRNLSETRRSIGGVMQESGGHPSPTTKSIRRKFRREAQKARSSGARQRRVSFRRAEAGLVKAAQRPQQ